MFKLGVVGLDTSHSVKFTELIQDEEKKIVDGLRIVSCMRFPSAFQSEPDQDERQKQLEDLGVNVTRFFEKAVEGVDGIMLEINDPGLHLEYVKKSAELDLPIFLDKPLADKLENGLEIYNLAQKKDLKIWSSSALRFIPEIIECAGEVPNPEFSNVFGPMGTAAKGSSLIWYGIHTFEMLMTLMGRGAKSVFARQDNKGIVAIVQYKDGQRGIVECNTREFKYGGRAQNSEKVATFTMTGNPYPNLIKAIHQFFTEDKVPVPMEETVEIQAMMEATEKSLESGKEEPVYQLI